MEEHVGRLWHRLITSAGEHRYPGAAVRLETIAHTVGVVFRALGGDGGLDVKGADATPHGARRGLLARMAGVGERATLAWRDERSLLLPPCIDLFPTKGLNRDLYLWLTALAAGAADPGDDWLIGNQRLTRRALVRFPGLAPRYRRLVEAHCRQRPDPSRLSGAAAVAEGAVRRALDDPGSVATLPQCRFPPYPVPLWLHPSPPLPGSGGGPDAGDAEQERDPGDPTGELTRRRRQTQRVAMPKEDRGLVTIRMENILTWGEFTQADRATDPEDDLDRARSAAEDLDRIALARDRKAQGARLRFDLDLPPAAEDDLVLSDGVLLPEWDWRHGRLLPNHCRVHELLAADAPPCALPDHLRHTAKRLRAQFEALAPSRVRRRGLSDGQDLDLDAYLRFAADRRAGVQGHADRLYQDTRPGSRDLACLLLADLSLSTDTWIDDQGRVIDAIRDSLFLFAESLAATGDRFAILGFSSRKRDPIRVHRLKGFDEAYGAAIRGRINAIRPGYYTRLGAGIRHAAGQLGLQPAARRLLIILSDGKPNDLDRYEGRWGIEDTRHAIREARDAGIEPFCVTIDPAASDYLPHLFGAGGYVVIHSPKTLPSRLPILYARLTRDTWA